MGILNITPDSFSDGARFTNTEAAISAAKQMLKDGADIIDIGGESTRPGADAVDAAEELRRVAPIVEALIAETDAVISIDTTKAEVAHETLKLGAHIINDVSALTADDAMIDTVGEFKAGSVLMHMQGTPRTMQNNPQYNNVTETVYSYLEQRIETVTSAGLARETIAIDPGIGFGKTTEHNLLLIANLKKLTKLQQPLLVGLSRKRFIGILTGMSVENRLSGSLAGLACSVLNGANIMRVHDVRPAWQAARIAAAVRCPENIDAATETAVC
jgi:dihydropteroate synthase